MAVHSGQNINLASSSRSVMLTVLGTWKAEFHPRNHLALFVLIPGTRCSSIVIFWNLGSYSWLLWCPGTLSEKSSIIACGRVSWGVIKMDGSLSQAPGTQANKTAYPADRQHCPFGNTLSRWYNRVLKLWTDISYKHLSVCVTKKKTVWIASEKCLERLSKLWLC